MQACLQPGQRARKAADPIGHDRTAELCIALEVLVGVDQHAVDLRTQAIDHMLHQRPTLQRLQSFVHASHAASLPAGEHRVRRSRRSWCLRRLEAMPSREEQIVLAGCAADHRQADSAGDAPRHFGQT